MKSILVLLPLLFFASCATRIKTSITMAEVVKLKNAKFEVTPIKKIQVKGLLDTYREIYGNDTNFTKLFKSSLELKIDGQKADKASLCIIEFPSIEIGESLAKIPRNEGFPNNNQTSIPRSRLGKKYDYMPCCTIDLHYIVKSNKGDILLEGHALAEIGGGMFARKKVMLTNAVKHIRNFLVSYLHGKMKSGYIEISKPNKQK